MIQTPAGAMKQTDGFLATQALISHATQTPAHLLTRIGAPWNKEMAAL